MHASAPDAAAPGTLQPNRSHTHPYASAPIKTSSNIHNEPVLLYRCVTTMSLHQYIHSGESSRAHHTKNPVQGARWRCTSYRDALGCIHYHKTSGASTSGKSEPSRVGKGRPTTKTPNPILDGFNGKHNILQVNIAAMHL